MYTDVEPCCASTVCVVPTVKPMLTNVSNNVFMFPVDSFPLPYVSLFLILSHPLNILLHCTAAPQAPHVGVVSQATVCQARRHFSDEPGKRRLGKQYDSTTTSTNERSEFSWERSEAE